MNSHNTTTAQRNICSNTYTTAYMPNACHHMNSASPWNEAQFDRKEVQGWKQKASCIAPQCLIAIRLSSIRSDYWRSCNSTQIELKIYCIWGKSMFNTYTYSVQWRPVHHNYDKNSQNGWSEFVEVTHQQSNVRQSQWLHGANESKVMKIIASRQHT